MTDKSGSPKGLISWAFYDWANSAYFVMIQTFIFSAYFAGSIASDHNTGTALWGNMVGIAGIFIAILAPLLGAIADEGGRRKPWIFFFTVLGVAGSSLLYFAEPSIDFLWFSLITAFIATLGSELSLIFYNAMLPDLAPSDKIGRWSGWGWGLGYLGGLLCLMLGYFVFFEHGVEWFGLDGESSQHVRITFLLTGIWYALFSVPFFLRTPDNPSKMKKYNQAISQGVKQLKDGFRVLKTEKDITKFLIARIFYNDGLATIFAMGGIYAAGTFGFDTSDIFLFGIALNLTAGLGAYGFAWIDDKAGSKKTIVISLFGLIVPVVAVIFAEASLWFWIWGLILGIFVGPVQAASRTLMGRMAPEENRNQMFGLLALSGKVTSFAGPILVGWVTLLFESQRAGMSIILFMLVVGLGIMLTVDDKRAPR